VREGYSDENEEQLRLLGLQRGRKGSQDMALGKKRKEASTNTNWEGGEEKNCEGDASKRGTEESV